MTDADACDEEALASALAAADESLANGSADDRSATIHFSADQNDELSRDLTFVARVRAALGRPTTVPDPAALPWRQLGRFLLRRELGRGGMGIVFLADDPLLGRLVALKVPRPEMLGTPELRERFRREARAASALDHANIVPVFEANADGPVLYLVAAYCDGPTLSAWLAARTERVPLTEAADLVAALAGAIAHAHDRGVIHRDLKPANILMASGASHGPGADAKKPGPSPAPLARITDFGLAKLADDVAATRTGAILGTVAYMAPEQAVGRAAAAGPAADVYSLGAILYELLAGRPPFVGDSELDVLAQVRAAEPVAPSLLRRTVPRDLETVCLKCLRKEPEKRYARAADLAEDLRRWRRGQPVIARPVSAGEHAWRWCRRNPTLASLAAAVAALLVTLAAGSSVAALWLNSERKAAVAAEERSERRRYEALLAQARAGRWGGQAGRRFASLDALAEAAGIARVLKMGDDARRDLRTEILACLPLVDVRPESAWDGFPADGRAVWFDEGLERYAVQQSAGPITVHAVGTGERLAELSHAELAQAELRHMAFSPCGRWLKTTCWHRNEGSLLVWDWRRGAVAAFYPRAAHLWPSDFSPDGRRLAVAHPDGSIRSRDLGEPSEQLVWPGEGMRDANPHQWWLRYDARGERLAARVASEGDVRVLDLATGRLHCRIPQHSSYYIGAFGRGGSLLAVTEHFDVQLWDLDTGAKHVKLSGHQGGISSMAFEPAGRLLASKSDDGSVRLWDADTGRQLLEFASEMYPQFSRDGSRIARRVGSRLEILAIDPAAECRRLPWPGKVISFAADGRHVALAAKEAGVRLIELAADRCLGHWPVPAASAAIVWPDGRGLWALSEETGLHRLALPAGTDPSSGRGPEFGRRGTSLAGSRDGRRVVAVLDEHLTAFDGVTGTEWAPTRPVPRGYFSALSADGRYSACSQWGGSEVFVWDGADPTPVLRWPLHPDQSPRVAFSPDGRWFGVGTGSEYVVFNVGTWSVRHQLGVRGRPNPVLAFSPDGRLLAAVHGRDAVRLFAPATGAELATLPPVSPEIIWSLAFSPDGRYLATGTEPGTAHLWDLGRIHARLAEHGLAW